MKRLSLAELKAQSGKVVENLEAIKGGNLSNCHNGALINKPVQIPTNLPGSGTSCHND